VVKLVLDGNPLGVQVCVLCVCVCVWFYAFVV
jgi:hypothetical protein